ncbi:MAG TPA: substrate-binding domain-containing protein [Gammaproteobacteria bacterium]|nr:substrate-binding domain-containing protein [Gammaproteobacteria bacterium]
MKRLLQSTAVALSLLAVGAAQAADPIVITHVNTLTGSLRSYGEQLHAGLRLGFEYATKGTMTVEGRPIKLIERDDQMNPARARALVEAAYAEDDSHIVIGTIASGIALAVLPLAAEYERIIIPQGVADSITGANWNRYVFRIGRNSSQDAISNAVALGKPGVCVATIAQDYAFGRDGVAAYKEAMHAAGGKVLHEEYLPVDATDFTAAGQRLLDALKDQSGCDNGKYIFGIWAGATNPFGRIQDMQPERYGIRLATGGNTLSALVGYKAFPNMEGAGSYYYENPKNPINDWFVAEHRKRYNGPPDFFTAQGFAEAVAVVEAIKRAGGSTDTEDLIAAFEGLEFETPKGRMRIREEDHQALQSMYHFRVRVDPQVEWGIPQLVREIKLEEMDIPVRNQR